MQPPFTTDQFLQVILQYNDAVWPMQVAFYVLAGVLLFLGVRPSNRSDRWLAGILAFLWAWMGVVYNWGFFTAINPAAWAFGGLFLVQAGIFLAAGVRGRALTFRFRADVFGLTGALFLAYALVLYPFLGAAAGHAYPNGPTFGLPCPTTIATFGLFLWAPERVPVQVLVVPFLWSLIGGSAAFQFGIPEDYGLVVAGVLGTAMIVVKNRRLSGSGGRRALPALGGAAQKVTTW